MEPKIDTSPKISHWEAWDSVGLTKCQKMKQSLNEPAKAIVGLLGLIKALAKKEEFGKEKMRIEMIGQVKEVGIAGDKYIAFVIEITMFFLNGYVFHCKASEDIHLIEVSGNHPFVELAIYFKSFENEFREIFPNQQKKIPGIKDLFYDIYYRLIHRFDMKFDEYKITGVKLCEVSAASPYKTILEALPNEHNGSKMPEIGDLHFARGESLGRKKAIAECKAIIAKKNNENNFRLAAT